MTSADCVWRGPHFLSAKAVLHGIYGENANASSFFNTFLQLPDAEYMDIVDELRLTQRTATQDTILARLVPVYTSLAAMVTTDNVAEEVR